MPMHDETNNKEDEKEAAAAELIVVGELGGLRGVKDDKTLLLHILAAQNADGTWGVTDVSTVRSAVSEEWVSSQAQALSIDAAILATLLILSLMHRY